MDRFSIALRIHAIALLLLGLFGAVTALAYVFLGQGESHMGDYARISGNVIKVLEINRDAANMGREIESAAGSVDAAATDRARNLLSKVGDSLSATLETMKTESRRQAMKELIAQHQLARKAFEQMVEARARREEAVKQQQALAGGATTILTHSMEQSITSDHPMFAAYVGLAQQQLALSRLEVSRFIASGNVKFAETEQVQFAAFEKAIELALSHAPDPEAHQQLQQGLDSARQFQQAFFKTRDLYPDWTVSDQRLGEAMTLFNQKAQDLRIMIGDALTQVQEETIQGSAMARRMALGLSVVALAIGMGFAVVVARGVVRPVSGMTGAMTRLAAGDKSVVIPGVGFRDEIGAMAKAVEIFRDNMMRANQLAEAQEKDRAARDHRTQKIEALVMRFDANVKATVAQVATAATHLNNTAQSMSDLAEDTSGQAAAVAAASEQASTNVDAVAAATEELSASVNEIARRVADSTVISSEAVEAAQRTGNLVEGLSNAVGNIGAIVDTITQIAGLTNLLALNATIEAARAGEAGKGFAVVAHEVKTLADQTAQATHQIASQVEGVRSATRQAVEGIAAVDDVISRMNEISTIIAAAVEEQGAATNEIARNAQQAATGTRQVSEHVAGLTSGARLTGEASSEVRLESGAVSGQTEKLHRDIEQFLEEVRAA